MAHTDCPFPYGGIYITTSVEVPMSTRPGTFRVPFGKWRCLVCVDNTSQSASLQKSEQEFGSAALAQQSISQGDGGSVNVTTWASNYQPSITVYMWKRVQFESQMTEWTNPYQIQEWQWITDKTIYNMNVIIDPNTLKAQQPNPYNP